MQSGLPSRLSGPCYNWQSTMGLAGLCSESQDLRLCSICGSQAGDYPATLKLVVARCTQHQAAESCLYAQAGCSPKQLCPLLLQVMLSASCKLFWLAPCSLKLDLALAHVQAARVSMLPAPSEQQQSAACMHHSLSLLLVLGMPAGHD